jgi:DNA-binding MarR family transcriptional regulator
MSSSLILDEFLPYRLSFTSNLVSGAIADSYRALFGLSIPEWRIIAHIAEHSGITQQEIGSRTRMDKVTVSRAAIALADRGLIARRPNPADRRSQRLVLSDEGEALYAAIAPKALELERTLFDRFSAQELATFTNMLRRIDEAVVAVTREGD